MGKEAAERRANPRFPAVFSIEGPSDENGVVARMEARDLSLGGVRCVSSTDFQEMTRLGVTLHLPEDESGAVNAIDVEAVVVRRQEIPSATQSDPRFELALFFTAVDDAAKVRLSRYLGC